MSVNNIIIGRTLDAIAAPSFWILFVDLRSAGIAATGNIEWKITRIDGGWRTFWKVSSDSKLFLIFE